MTRRSTAAAEPRSLDPEPRPDATATEPTPAVEPEAPTTEAPATCPHGADAASCPLCALDAGSPAPSAEPADSEPAPEPEAAPADEALDDEAWNAAVADAPSEVDLPLDPGEEIIADRTDESGDLIVVTSFGRKIGISPDGWIAVLMGADLATRVPSDPKPPRKSWKEPR